MDWGAKNGNFREIQMRRTSLAKAGAQVFLAPRQLIYEFADYCDHGVKRIL